MTSDDVEVDLTVGIDRDELGDGERVTRRLERSGLDVEVAVEVTRRGAVADDGDERGDGDGRGGSEKAGGGEDGEAVTVSVGSGGVVGSREGGETTVVGAHAGDERSPVDPGAAADAESAVERDRSSGGGGAGSTSEEPLDESETPPGSDAFEEKDRRDVVEDPTVGVGSGDPNEHGAGADVDLSSTGGTEPGTAEDDPGPELADGADDHPESHDLGSVPTTEEVYGDDGTAGEGADDDGASDEAVDDDSASGETADDGEDANDEEDDGGT